MYLLQLYSEKGREAEVLAKAKIHLRCSDVMSNNEHLDTIVREYFKKEAYILRVAPFNYELKK